jgi:ribosomal-protein-alanine N-acetyltransferase
MNARIAELGFQFCADAWGQGFATEASTAVIEWARTEGFSALIAGHHPDNLASKRALVRLGFSYTHDEL